MQKIILIASILFFAVSGTKAQLGVVKLVGKNTKDYKPGASFFIKTGFPVNEGSDFTIEAGANLFPLGENYFSLTGTAMCPLKIGYRHTLNQTGEGFYIEPQAGYNLYGVTSLYDDRDEIINLKYHGLVLAAGAGYLFTLLKQPFDLNLRYETVIAHGGSNNFISLGISRFISFGKRD